MSTTRIAILGLGCLLGIFAAWILLAEMLRPRAIVFSTDSQSAASIYAKRGAAITAARLGLVRGDLWAEAAIAFGVMLWQQEVGLPQLGETQALIETAIAYAPYDSRLWLLLAASDYRFDQSKEKASAALKMSYYTGPNMTSILPQRLLLALQRGALEDDEMRELVRHDIRVAATHKPRLMPALVASYRDAPPSGRQFIEKTLAELDPTALSEMRTESQRP